MGIQIPDGYIDISPVMTSNNTPSGYVASASSVNGTGDAWKAFDGKMTTLSDENVWHSAGGMPQWIMLKFPEAVRVDLFTVASRGDTGNAAAKGILSFSLQASNNGTSFETLGTYTRPGDVGLVTSHLVNNAAEYQYYRIYITEAGYVYGTTQYALVDDIHFYTYTNKFEIPGYENVGGALKSFVGGYENVGGVLKKLLYGYQNVGGVLKLLCEDKTPDAAGNPLGSLAVGSVVKMNVGGVPMSFIVVNQGLPSSVYDSSCSGTWLLMEDIYESRAWNTTNNDYANSDIHSYLNNTFVNLFDSGIKSAIKQVKIPYTNGTGTAGSVASGSSGLSAKVFLLSYTEVGFSGASNANVEGGVLSYFNGVADSKRIAYLNGTAYRWCLRSPGKSGDYGLWYVNSSGGTGYYSPSESYGIRPALVLPSDMLVDENMNVIA